MARRNLKFRQRDIVRAVKGATAAGLHVTGFSVDPQTGKIEVVTDKSAAQGSAVNPWDRAMEELKQ